ncbi:MAG: leucine-rich repeat protein [Ruminococcus sp.]|nr:leucine-rich repeat protein [Ruminococcus sp.]
MKVNRIIASIMAVCVMGFGVPYVNMVAENNSAITASAVNYTEGTYGQLTYKNYVDYIEISGCDKKAETVVIPAEIDGVPVMRIGDFAFEKCKGLISVEIPDSVTSIGAGAFYACHGLTSIEIPDSITSIRTCAFFYCSSLTSIEIPDSVTIIESTAFSDTPWLEEKRKENPLIIVNNILIDGETCSGDVIIPDCVTSIVEHAFYYCSNLTSIEIPENVESIGWWAFFECEKLKEITILNPECEIYDDKVTISDTATIYGYENSTAQAYAEKYGRKFVSLGKAPEKETCSGDMNGDNSVNIADTVLLQSYILGRQELTEEQYKNADLTGDGFIDSFDLVLLRQKIIENNK